jgi:uncharacterized protein (DUF2062 family)
LSTKVTIRFRIPTWSEVRRTLRYHRLHVVHRSRDPHTAAFSFALGVFLGLMPISVLATMLALFVPRRLGMRTLPAVIGTFTSNWFTAPFIIAASAMTGQFLTTGRFAGFKAMLPADNLGAREAVVDVFRQGGAFLLGITVVSLVGAAIAYAIVYWAVEGAIKIRKAKIVDRMRSHIHMPHLPHLRHPVPPGKDDPSRPPAPSRVPPPIPEKRS